MTTHYKGYLVSESGFKVGNQDAAYDITPGGASGNNATIVVGAESTSVCNVAVQFNDPNGSAAAAARAAHVYFTTDAAGQTMATLAAAIGTDGTIIAQNAASTASYLVVSEADGDLDLDVTKAGAYTAYMHIVNPDGSLTTSGVITWT